MEEGCDVFNRPRSEMLQVEDAELVGSQALLFLQLLIAFITRSAVNVRAICNGFLSVHFPRHYSGLSWRSMSAQLLSIELLVELGG